MSKEFTSNKIGKISWVFQEDNLLLPFEIKTPIFSVEEYNVWLDITKKYEYYDDLPGYVKEDVQFGEKIALFEEKFRNFLKFNGYSINNYQKLSKQEKEQLLTIWMNKEKISKKLFNIKKNSLYE